MFSSSHISVLNGVTSWVVRRKYKWLHVCDTSLTVAFKTPDY